MKKKHSKKHRLKFLFVILFLSLFSLALLLGQQYLKVKNLTPGDLPIISSFFPSARVINQQITEEVLPKEGFQSQIYLGDAILKLVSYGVIDKEKMENLYQNRGGLVSWQKDMLDKPSAKPLIVTQQNATWLVNMLWPVGLANKMEVNNQSPIAGARVGNYASTGGWNLGREQNGGVYFNQYSIIPLTPKEEQRVKYLAEQIYRPCCNNSTFFQDCNHGSAALALIELGVSEKLSDKEIYKTVLAFNSFWFPQNYLETAFYFRKIKGIDWENIDPKIILSKDYSSITGWLNNVDAVAQKTPDLLPTIVSGGRCGA